MWRLNKQQHLQISFFSKSFKTCYEIIRTHISPNKKKKFYSITEYILKKDLTCNTLKSLEYFCASCLSSMLRLVAKSQ